MTDWTVTHKELAYHKTPTDLWIAIDGHVWDITSFAPTHPGGIDILLQHAGADATKEYLAFHTPSLVRDILTPDLYVGTLESPSTPSLYQPPSSSIPASSTPYPEPLQQVIMPRPQPTPPSIELILSLRELYSVAPAFITPKAYAYISSYACDGHTDFNNRLTYSHISLRPRVLRDVAEVSTATTLLGRRVRTPIFASPTALAKVVNPEGEKEIARGCAGAEVAMCLSTGASFDVNEVAGALGEWYEGAGDEDGWSTATNATGSTDATIGSEASSSSSSSTSSSRTEVAPEDKEDEEKDATQDDDPTEKIPFIFQLYVHKDHRQTEKLLARVLRPENDVAAVMVTVDAPVAGKREADEKMKLAPPPPSNNTATNNSDNSKPNTPESEKGYYHAPMSALSPTSSDRKGLALGRQMASFISPSLTFSDTIPWLLSLLAPTATPLFLKGIQTPSDALLAAASGVHGIVISNHGGRSLDTAPPSILVLLELQRHCPKVFDKLEVWIDGGIMRGTDVFKALCLGAGAVGVGRGVLYGLGMAGERGVGRVFEILQDELETAMRMCGVTSLDDLHPGILNTAQVDHMVLHSSDEHQYAKWRRSMAKKKTSKL